VSFGCRLKNVRRTIYARKITTTATRKIRRGGGEAQRC